MSHLIEENSFTFHNDFKKYTKTNFSLLPWDKCMDCMRFVTMMNSSVYWSVRKVVLLLLLLTLSTGGSGDVNLCWWRRSWTWKRKEIEMHQSFFFLRFFCLSFRLSYLTWVAHSVFNTVLPMTVLYKQSLGHYTDQNWLCDLCHPMHCTCPKAI